jgi:hypothetical protein
MAAKQWNCTPAVGADLRAAAETSLLADLRFSWEGRPPCRPTNRFQTPGNKEKNGTARRPSLPETIARRGGGRGTRVASNAPSRGLTEHRARGPSIRNDFDFQIDEIVDQMHTEPMKVAS